MLSSLIEFISGTSTLIGKLLLTLRFGTFTKYDPSQLPNLPGGNAVISMLQSIAAAGPGWVGELLFRAGRLPYSHQLVTWLQAAIALYT